MKKITKLVAITIAFFASISFIQAQDTTALKLFPVEDTLLMQELAGSLCTRPGNIAYRYDKLNRMTLYSVCNGDNFFVQFFSYDFAGNRIDPSGSIRFYKCTEGWCTDVEFTDKAVLSNFMEAIRKKFKGL